MTPTRRSAITGSVFAVAGSVFATGAIPAAAVNRLPMVLARGRVGELIPLPNGEVLASTSERLSVVDLDTGRAPVSADGKALGVVEVDAHQGFIEFYDPQSRDADGDTPVVRRDGAYALLAHHAA